MLTKSFIMEIYTIVSWNIRGASRDINRANLRAVVKESKADFLCVQETKVQSWSEKAIKQLGMGFNSGWTEISSTGRSGGLLSVWNKDIFHVSEIKATSSWIQTKGYIHGSKIPFACLNVYTPQKTTSKRRL